MMVLIYIFLMAMMFFVYMCVLNVCILSLENVYSYPLTMFKLDYSPFFCVCVSLEFFIHFRYNSVVRHTIGKIFLQFVCCLFTLLMVSFEAEIFLIWKKPDLFNFSFVACIFGVIYKKLLKPRS